MSFGPIPNKPNIIILMTDQQRAFRYFPESWIDTNLPNFRKLQKNGATFTNAICNASRCSPSRSVLYTGKYTAQTQVFNVGGTLDPEIATIGRIMKEAGYKMAYKGKWHLTAEMDDDASTSFQTFSESRPVDPKLAHKENRYLAHKYDIDHWNSPDSGNEAMGTPASAQEPSSIPTDPNESLSSEFFTIGGSLIDNDARYVNGTNKIPNEQSAIDFLTEYKLSKSTEPFCLAVSLANPHDVAVFPNQVQSMQYWKQRSIWQSYTDIVTPPTMTESLSTKPSIQQTYVNNVNSSEPFNTPPHTSGLEQLEYLQFYAYLNTLPDQLFDTLMNTMSQDLIENTIIIRLADHGEMGISHGGMRFKDYNAYQETINVPLVFSNPLLFPEPKCLDQLVGLVDLMPTLASIVGLDQATIEKHHFRGIDFSSVLLNTLLPTQESLLFSYDDKVPAGQVGHIRTLVKANHKFSCYYSMTDAMPNGNVNSDSFQYELYDMISDPTECTNLLPVGGQAQPHALALQIKLYSELTLKMKHTHTTPPGWPDALPKGIS